MKIKTLFLCAALSIFAAFSASGQLPQVANITILKAEDSLRYDKALEALISHDNAAIRQRAALAAGRIGDKAAVQVLSTLALNESESAALRSTAVFALGEIESINAADAILKLLGNEKLADAIRSAAVEAAGKIAAAATAANREAAAKDPQILALGKAIIATLESENAKADKQNTITIIQGLTAALRVRPEGAEQTVSKFLTNADARVRADVGNTLSRLRAKSANPAFRKMLAEDIDAVARANAARALGAADDKEAFDLLLRSALNDADSRVRVSAVRSLAQINDKRAAEPLLKRGNELLAAFTKAKKPNLIPAEKNELLEISTALGRLFDKSENAEAVKFLEAFRIADNFTSPENETAFARIAPQKYIEEFSKTNSGFNDHRVISAYAAGITVLAANENEDLKMKARSRLMELVGDMGTKVKKADEAKMQMAMPSLLRAIAAFKPDNLDSVLRSLLENEVFLKTAAAEIISNQPTTAENIAALKKAFAASFIRDRAYNDAILGIMDALFKLDKNESVGILLTALESHDNLVRRKAFTLLEQIDKERFPGVDISLRSAREKNKHQVLPHTAISNSRSGQVLNKDIDYRRALSRKNGSVRAVLNTTKGSFTIEFYPEEAPLTVDNFIKLARANYFNGLEVHRVVANFVMQDGDPLGNGSGGPGWTIRCEVNPIMFERGTVGMALSGKDTGGSQWFVAHSPQPHLDGGYTVFGKVNETGMKVVDNIVRGDKIITVRIVQSSR